MKSRQRTSRKRGALLGAPLAEGTGSGRAREVTLVTREALLPSHNPRVRGLFERTRTTCRSPVPRLGYQSPENRPRTTEQTPACFAT